MRNSVLQATTRRILLLGAAATLGVAMLGGRALAQATDPGADAEPESALSIWSLFAQSFDLFTILIIAGSIFAVTIIIRSIVLQRRDAILPEEAVETVNRLVAERNWPELQNFVREDHSFLSRVLRESLPKLSVNPMGIYEATEMAAEDETARRFKEVEWLGVIGNLGPLLGLVGTVWGMIIAFTAIGETGGQAAAAQLSTGIAKALFHTFLGLMLAIPSLLAYGLLRERLDRVCTRGTMLATDAVSAIATLASQPATPRPPQARPAQPQPQPQPQPASQPQGGASS